MANTDTRQLYGYLAEFRTPEHLLDAAARVRDAGYTRWDCHTPFPLHGLDIAMGIRGTRLPWIILAGGLTGMVGALLMQWWMNAVDYKFWISGKPFFGIPANIPITFEFTVLLSAITAFFAMWGINGLPRHHHPLLRDERFRRATADRFYIAIEASDPKFDLETTPQFLASLSPDAVAAVED